MSEPETDPAEEAESRSRARSYVLFGGAGVLAVYVIVADMSGLWLFVGALVLAGLFRLAVSPLFGKAASLGMRKHDERKGKSEGPQGGT